MAQANSDGQGSPRPPGPLGGGAVDVCQKDPGSPWSSGTVDTIKLERGG